jgi:8-oxo-dGTP diphosphatase
MGLARHTSGKVSIDHVAIAILRHGDHLVMVQEPARVTDRPYWVLPGGLVEPGELVTEGLIREVKEETGAQVTKIGRLAFISQIDRPALAEQCLAFVFEIADWEGTLESQDPDGKVSSAELVAEADAISRLEHNGGWVGVQEPLLAFLRGGTPAGAIWFYREGAENQCLVGSLPPSSLDEPAQSLSE